MIDTFYIGAYWNGRMEPLDIVVNKTLQELNQLGQLDEQFTNLYELGMSRKKALENKLSLSAENIKRVYQKRIKKNEINNIGESELGFGFSVWTGHKEGESSQLSIIAGSDIKGISNSSLIRLPYEGNAMQRLLTIDKVKQMIGILVDLWEPNNVICNSSFIRDFFETKKGEQVFADNHITGWVTYVKKIKRPSVSNNIVHEDNFHGGHLFYLKTNDNSVYDYDSMQDLLPLIDFV